MRKSSAVGLLGLALVGAAVGVGCSGGGSSTPGGGGASTSAGYKGLGSIWSMSSVGSGFVLTYDANKDGTIDTAGADMRITGTIENLGNSYQKLTVVTGEGTNAPTAGDTGYGLEVPGFAYFLRPVDESAEPIVMVRSGSCPAGSTMMNWMIAKWDAGGNPRDDQDSDGFGTAEFDSDATNLTVNQYNFHDGAVIPGGGSFPVGTCENGRYDFADPGNPAMTTTMFATSNGGMLVKPGPGIIFAAPQLGADPAIADTDGTYSGFIFNESNGSAPAKVVLTNGTGTGEAINPATDASESATVALSLSVKAGMKGVLTGTIDGRPLNCVLSQVSGKQILACNGAEGAAVGNRYPVFFFLGVKR